MTFSYTRKKGKVTGEIIEISLVKYPEEAKVGARISFDGYARTGWIYFHDTKDAWESFFACIRKISGRHTPEEDRAVYELSSDWYEVAWELRNHTSDISAEETVALYRQALKDYDAKTQAAG